MLITALMTLLGAIAMLGEWGSGALFILVGLSCLGDHAGVNGRSCRRESPNCYGANWAIMPAFMTGRFGKENMVFGFVTPVLLMSVAVKVMSIVTADEYDSHKDPGSQLNSPVVGIRHSPSRRQESF